MHNFEEHHQRFEKSNRLLKSDEFTAVFKKPFRVKGNGFLILVKKNRLTTPRLGLAVSKKSEKRAVGRNLIKRIIRESFRRNKEILKGLDIVVISQKGIAELDQLKIKNDLEQKWKFINEKLSDTR